MATPVQQRRGYAAQWTSVNPVLRQGELGYELDTGKIKFGDGITAWNSLPYFTGGAGTGDLLAANNLSDVASAATSRQNLGLEIGVNVQAYDAELAAIAGLTSAADKLPYFTGSGTAALADLTAAARTVLDDATVAAMVDTLGGASSTGTGGLVRSASPALTNTPTAPTAAPGTNTTQIANTAFVQAAVSAAVSGLLELKGNLDCSANPNYPAASAGDTYYVSVAGKVGGASGVDVDIGDAVIAKADNAGGTQAAVGTSWFVLEKNLSGVLLAANNLSDLTNAATARTNLGLGTAATQASTAFQAADATLTALAALTITSNSLTIGTGTDAFSQTSFAANTFPARASTGALEAKTITDFGLSILDDADAAAVRTTLGLGSAATQASSAFQTADGTLTAFAALTMSANTLTIGTGTDTVSQTSFAANTFPARASTGDLVAKTITDFGLSLVDDSSAPVARQTLGVDVFDIGFSQASVSDGTVYMTAKASFAFTINQVRGLKTTSGTCTLAVKINGTNVTGMSSLSVTSTTQDATATAANSVAVGDEVTFVFSSSSSPVDLRFTLKCTR